MRVAHSVPVTWRGRTPEEAQPIDLRAHAIATMRRLTDNLDLKKVRAISKRVLTIIHKGRSDSQQPGPLERLFELLWTAKKAGASEQDLRAVVIGTLEVIEAEERATPISEPDVLEAMHKANIASAEETLAESRLLTRGDRILTPGELDRLADATRREIAALESQLRVIARLRRQTPTSRRGLAVLRGGAPA